MNGHFEIGGITPTRYFFSIAIVLGLLFAMISADQDKPIAIVFIQWQLQSLVPMALLIGSHILLLRIHAVASLNPWFALAISGLVGGSLFAPFALGIEIWLEAARPQNIPAELTNEWLSVVPPVTLCWLALNAPWLMGYRLEKTGEAEPESREPAQAVDNQAEFMQLVPADKRGSLVLLKAELHYLQVVTDRGSTLILYNLGDAIAQLPAELGLAVHRSYWVARDAIDSLEKRGRQGELILEGGQRVPVSRNRMPAVSAQLAMAD